MNVLLIGNGGREHALAWKIKQSPLLTRLFCNGDNPGIGKLAELVDLDSLNAGGISIFCRQNQIDLVIVGPEAPLAAGVCDILRQHKITVFGPSKAAACLETSKFFTKSICREQNIPTASFAYFENEASALASLASWKAPIVVKADGLAAGKGVSICETVSEAEDAIRACFSGAFGESGASVVIEEKLSGEEISFFALCDGKTAVALESAQDYKRAFDGDKGPNTGGMGAVSPAPLMSAELSQIILQTIVQPTLEAMVQRGTPFQGVLYAGLMMTQAGPKLIEYNVRFGDPECQVLMLRLKSDLLPLLYAAASGNLAGQLLEWTDQTAITVVMAARGYPGNYQKGTVISGLDTASRLSDVTIFHAGTARKNDVLVSNGGRVLNVCALGSTPSAARNRAYEAIACIDWPNGFCRNDIGWRSLERQRS